MTKEDTKNSKTKKPKATKSFESQFKTEVAPNLKEELGIKNVMALPKITKVSINVGIGSYITRNGKDFDHIVENVTKISGQKPIITKSKKAISNFKLRENMPVGVVVTLRGERMYDFVNKLVNVVFPRVRDFRGISPKAFDGQGNYNIGFKEHTVFPEISHDDVINLHGVEVSIKTTAKNNAEGLALLKALGFPFIKPINN